MDRQSGGRQVNDEASYHLKALFRRKNSGWKSSRYPWRIIYQCSEDGAADTIRPRLEACGANCENVAFIDEEVHDGLPLDDERIRQAIIEFHPRLVVLNPIEAYIGNDADLHTEARSRKLMRRLNMWASANDCALVLIGHLNKKEGGKDLYRGLGSIDVVAAARSVLYVERDEADEDVRIIHQKKTVLSGTGLMSVLRSGMAQDSNGSL